VVWCFVTSLEGDIMTVKRQRVSLALELRSCTASSKGRKHTMEDVPLVIDVFGESAGTSRALYGVLDGHGGRECATRVSESLPGLLAEELAPLAGDGGCDSGTGGPTNCTSGGSHAGGNEGVGSATGASAAAVKEAVRRAFGRCDAELLVECEAHGWCDGCCAVIALLDLHASPPRGYVASLGDCRAYACVESAGGEVRAVPLCKGDHSPLLAAERRRIEAAGGSIEKGRVGLQGDLWYINLGDQASRLVGQRNLFTTTADVGQTLGIYDLALRYRFGERESAIGKPGSYSVIPYAGVRLIDGRLSLAAAGCQRGDLSKQTAKTEARICTELATVNQALETVAALTPSSTVGEARAAQQSLEKSIAALETSENQLQKLRVEAFRKLLQGFKDEVAQASANKDQTLEEAANGLKPKAMAVIAARKALSAAVECEEPTPTTPSKP